MSDPHYARLREAYHEVCDLAPGERAARVASLSRGDGAFREELERLLRAGDEADRAPDPEPMFRRVSAAPTIAGFAIVGLLGEGGMGEVYEAEQESPRRRVALKVMRPGLISAAVVRRFEREAEVLARLKHAGIAQIYAVGVGEVNGRSLPYFAMELVEGEPLVRYATSARLDVPGRLEVACRMCDAVEHAHQRGVIHRDLKPANVLVEASGQPKILDFGIARLTESDVRATTLRTEAGQILGTAAYMSPEQASGDPSRIDVRTDVYSLGVVIFELLTGRLPHAVERLALPDAIRVIREEEATRIGSIDTRLRGDIETILAKALEQDAARRYQSAGELAADIRRFLRHEPVLARRPSTFYQLQKFARRNKALVVGVGAVMAALAGGLVATSVALHREGVARREAEEEAARASAAVAFLEDVLLALSPMRTQGRDTELLREMLDGAAESIGSDGTIPSVRAQMLSIIGRVYHNIFEYERSVALLTEAVAIFEELGPEFAHDWTEAQLVLGSSLAELRDAGGAERELRAVERRLRPGDDPEQRIAVLRELAELKMDQGEWASALEHIERARGLLPLVSGSQAGRVEMMNGAILRRLNRLEEAEESFERSLALFREGGGAIEECIVLNSLAVLARQQGRPLEAERLYREAMEGRLAADPRPNPDTATTLANLGRLLVSLERFDEATPILEQSLQMHRELYASGQFHTAMPMMTLAEIHSKNGRHDRAIETSREALAIAKGGLPARHPVIVRALSEVGENLLRADRFAEAEPLFREAHEMALALDLDPEVYVVSIDVGLARSIRGQGETERALEQLNAALQLYPADSGAAAQLRSLCGEWN